MQPVLFQGFSNTDTMEHLQFLNEDHAWTNEKLRCKFTINKIVLKYSNKC